jgi:hypothetical protein
MKNKDQFLKRLGALKQERASFLSHWKELSDYILPRRGRFLSGSGETNKGSKKNGKIIDSTATDAVEILVSGLMSGITSPARPWFRLGTTARDLLEAPGVREWMHHVESSMQAVFAKSNVYDALPQVYEELAVFGTGAMVVLDDDEDIIRCHTLTAGEFMIANDKRNKVNTLYREISMTVGQMIEEYGEDKVSDHVKSSHTAGSVDQWIEVVHVIEPNDGRNLKKADAKNKKYLSVHFEKGGNPEDFLRISGFNSFPAMAPRWHVMGSDVYGRSPAMKALGDIKALQIEQKRKGQGIEKMINPPVNAPAMLKDAIGASMIPGGVNYYDSTTGAPGITPVYQVDPRLGELKADIAETQARISRAFHADLFLMMTQSDRRSMTAEEVIERRSEKMLILGPMLERVHNDLLDPLIDRTFEIMFNRGLIPEPPEVLQGMDLKVEFISMLAQAQQAVGIGAIERGISFLATAAQFDPGVVDKFNFEQAVDEYGLMLGLSPQLLRSDEDVTRIRAEKAEAAAALATKNEQLQQSMIAAQGAKVLSQTDTGGKNALTDMINAGLNKAGAGQ